MAKLEEKGAAVAAIDDVGGRPAAVRKLLAMERRNGDIIVIARERGEGRRRR